MGTGTVGSREVLTPSRVSPMAPYLVDAEGWTPGSFAREQLRGLVRQVFFSNVAHPVRQVVFSAVESPTDVGSICRQVGETLASEIEAGIAVVGCNPETQEASEPDRTRCTGEGPVARPQPFASRVRGNLWFVADSGFAGERRSASRSFSEPHVGYERLAELRREFEYSIVACAPAGESSDAAAMGQLADGVVLVLAAHRTRRATARKIMDTLRTANVQLLGTVLSDRTFPIPQGIYRRL